MLCRPPLSLERDLDYGRASGTREYVYAHALHPYEQLTYCIYEVPFIVRKMYANLRNAYVA